MLLCVHCVSQCHLQTGCPEGSFLQPGEAVYSVSISSSRQRPGITNAQPSRTPVCCCAALSDDGKMVVLDGWTHVKPLFWAPLLPTAHIRIISFVYLAKTDGAS